MRGEGGMEILVYLFRLISGIDDVSRYLHVTVALPPRNTPAVHTE
jgi:hypothetical protein